MNRPTYLTLGFVVCSFNPWCLTAAPVSPAPVSRPAAYQEKVEDDTEIKTAKDAEVSLDSLLTGAEVWKWTPEQLEKDFKSKGFRWLSEKEKDRGMVRPKWMWLKNDTTSSSTGKKVTNLTSAKQHLQLFAGKISAEEVGFELKDGKLTMVTISVWNKGDSDEISGDKFLKLLAELKDAITANYKGSRPVDLGKDNASAAKASKIRWETPDTIVQLESSFDKDKARGGFQGEFIRLRIAPFSKTAVGGGPGNSAKVTQTDLLARVKKEGNGDVWVSGVPMVDQGDKGYCALASSERVMKYYGIECDQHDMAKASDGGANGTNPKELEEALHKLQGPFKIKVRDIIHWDIKDYEKFTETYNREAKRLNARQCPRDYFWTSFRGLDKDALLAARMKGTAYERWHKAVVDATSKGVPLLWGLELGIFPENGEKAMQSGGGHMRVILGYNDKTEELLFSDSWGAGHELKRMAAKDAFTVTKGLYQVEPQAR